MWRITQGGDGGGGCVTLSPCLCVLFGGAEETGHLPQDPQPPRQLLCPVSPSRAVSGSHTDRQALAAHRGELSDPVL